MHAKCLIQENEWEVRAAKRGVDTLAMAFYSVLHASPLLYLVSWEKKVWEGCEKTINNNK